MVYQKIINNIGAFLGVAMGISIQIGIESRNPLIPVVTFLVTIGVYQLTKGKIKRPVHDERTVLIHSKASNATFVIFLMGSYLVGSILLMMDTLGYGSYFQTGATIFLMGFIFAILHYVFRYYYHSKFGG